MTNHIHLVVTPRLDIALARAMQAVQSRYTTRMNKEYHWNGHLWQGRFFSCPGFCGRLIHRDGALAAGKASWASAKEQYEF